MPRENWDLAGVLPAPLEGDQSVFYRRKGNDESMIFLMDKIFGVFKFIVSSFGPLLVFYITNHFFGLMAAVVASVVWTLGEIAHHMIQKKPLSLFFKFTAGITIVFGLVDLYLQQSLLFKYEATLTNVMVGIFFAASVLGKKPIIREFAEAEGRIPKEISRDGEYYFQFMTIVWSVYSFGKAFFYFWVASQYSLEEGLAIRMMVGNISFYSLLFISIFGSKQIRFLLGKLKMLPSTANP